MGLICTISPLGIAMALNIIGHHYLECSSK